ncbi:MAG: hypothetical protein IT405_02065 [Candidatus Yanofskybacteria bacterium]|nr:hypothetical protein [Candidatus Yanofskybacteria bacterium]
MITTYAVVGAFALWYAYFGTEYYLNGGALGRGPSLMPFQCFWDEVRQNIPGGLTRKAAFIRELAALKPHGAIVGRRRVWRYADVAAHSLYRECAADVLRGSIEFWATVVGVVSVGAMLGIGLSLLLKDALHLLLS